MSFDALRRQAAEIDEVHDAAMRDIDDRLAELHFGDDAALAASRRTFLTRVAAGGAIAFGATAIPLAALVPAAAAQTTGTTAAGPSGSAGATAGSTPTNPALAADLAVAEFARSVELAAFQLYTQAVDGGELDSAVAQVARTFGRHHEEHAAAFATLSGDEEAGTPNAAILAQFSTTIGQANDQSTVVQALYSIEEGAAATYQWALGILQTNEGAAAASRIMPVEGQHAVALSQIITPDVTVWASQLPTVIPTFQTDAGAWTPDKYATR